MESVYEVVRIKQVVAESQLKSDKINTPHDAAQLVHEYIGDDDREVILVMALNIKNYVVSVHRAHIGGLNQSLAVPRDIYKSAVLNNAASVIVAHQHPSGDATPSQNDIDLAKRLDKSGDILGIQLLDKLVVGDYLDGILDYTSLKENGYIG